jgi:hypothetical protein
MNNSGPERLALLAIHSLNIVTYGGVSECRPFLIVWCTYVSYEKFIWNTYIIYLFICYPLSGISCTYKMAVACIYTSCLRTLPEVVARLGSELRDV